MMHINMVPVAHSWEIEKEFGIRIFDCKFAEIAESSSYVRLNLNEEYIEDLKDNIAFWRERNRANKAKKYENELNLVNKFRELGYKDKIIIRVSW